MYQIEIEFINNFGELIEVISVKSPTKGGATRKANLVVRETFHRHIQVVHTSERKRIWKCYDKDPEKIQMPCILPFSTCPYRTNGLCEDGGLDAPFNGDAGCLKVPAKRKMLKKARIYGSHNLTFAK